MAEYVQVRLRDGSTGLTCWVDRAVKQGQVVTLKDYPEPGRRWLVERVYETRQGPPPRRAWKVGGLT